MNNKLRLSRLKELEFMLLNHKKIFKEKKITFDMWEWGTKQYDLKTTKKIIGKKKVPIKELCGSAACALGSAAIYPPFIKQGLHLKEDEISVKINYDRKVPELEYYFSFVPSYKRETHKYAGAKFFGITDNEADNLFMTINYEESIITTKDVAERVKKLIKKYEGK